ncbi:Os03g0626500 [Oryza sativa Japonica Group]|uniref:Type I inositol-1,4,5-trisphosphate 5-phosphatase 11, putative, expressed n=2 Tax=Oryza sativa subsp. japonica TaxID=39947 RepID=Q10GI9_ORYSJ|nr:Type I inositol-1,4,5-trisphosphate 5-phosphatase 11, putative, expressed [Oryza sativa Japonica Group]BAF12615.1 Os03g0626500 [Oryza sativa Japonica Group]|eukprot:NP_001050701.1 Os03g0626500 [Oryza sativa Japonica Group]
MGALSYVTVTILEISQGLPDSVGGVLSGPVSNVATRWGLSDLHCKGMVPIDEDETHEGIKTIRIQKACEFTTSSVLCVCIITWNMNGKMSVEDVTKLVSSNRKFDLLVFGLQEVPKCDVAQVLQETMAETHILLCQKTMQSLQMFLFGAKSSEKYIRELKVDKHAVGGCGDITVWLGDLNYRLQGISSIPARKLIEENRQSKLRGKDQLLQEAEKGEVFNGYCEGTLLFKPTYKYNIGSSNYDTSYKIRVPSWTDRILFKVDHTSGLDAVLNSYEALDCIRSSDHKPVRAHLCLKVHGDSA